MSPTDLNYDAVFTFFVFSLYLCMLLPKFLAVCNDFCLVETLWKHFYIISGIQVNNPSAKTQSATLHFLFLPYVCTYALRDKFLIEYYLICPSAHFRVCVCVYMCETVSESVIRFQKNSTSYGILTNSFFYDFKTKIY